MKSDIYSDVRSFYEIIEPKTSFDTFLKHWKHLIVSSDNNFIKYLNINFTNYKPDYMWTKDYD